jgi:hypothetical protein
VRASVEAYLAAMRREWKPEAIEIGEAITSSSRRNGARLEVHNVDVQVDQRPVVRVGAQGRHVYDGRGRAPHLQAVYFGVSGFPP